MATKRIVIVESVYVRRTSVFEVDEALGNRMLAEWNKGEGEVWDEWHDTVVEPVWSDDDEQDSTLLLVEEEQPGPDLRPE